MLFVAVPAVMLAGISFCQRDALGRLVFEFTLENYVRAFDPVWWRIFANSLLYAGAAALVCLVLGYPAAFFMARCPEPWRTRLVVAVMIPFWTSFLIRTYAWIVILSKEGLLNASLAAVGAGPVQILYTPQAVVLGLVYTYLPFMVLPIYASAERLDQSLIEAAQDLGAGVGQTFLRVIWPLTLPGVVAGLLLVFVPAVAMFAITSLMGGGATPTIGEVIHNQFTRARNQPFGAALGTLLLVLFLFSLGVLAWVNAMVRRREAQG